MTDPAFRTLKANWDLSSDGYVEPNRTLLIDLAFRIAAAIQPEFTSDRTEQEVSSSSEEFEYGGWMRKRVCRRGNPESGIAITDTVSDACDGMTPFDAAIEIQVYGLPKDWQVELIGSFTSPIRGKTNPAQLAAHLPEALANTVSAILQKDFGARVVDS